MRLSRSWMTSWLGTNETTRTRRSCRTASHRTPNPRIAGCHEQYLHLALNSLKVDGGIVYNELLKQFQYDILGVPVVLPTVAETTSLGAAFAAGLAVVFGRIPTNFGKTRVWTRPGNRGLKPARVRRCLKAGSR